MSRRDHKEPDPATPDTGLVIIPRDWLLGICACAEAIAAAVQASRSGNAAGAVDVLFQSLLQDIALHKPIPAKYTAVAEAFGAIEALCRDIIDSRDDGCLFDHLKALGPAGKCLRVAVDAVPVNALLEALDWPTAPLAAAGESVPDGPYEPVHFGWRGRSWEIKGFQWHLLRALWNKGQVEEEAVLEAVYGEHHEGRHAGRESSMLRALQCRVNQKLTRLKIPLKIRLRSAHLELVSTEKPASYGQT